MLIVVEIEAAIDTVGTLATFLFSSEGWTTLPTDTPANTWVRPRLIQAANFRRELFSGNRVFGAVQAAYGECKLANLDGGLDDFVRYGFDGRRYTIRMGNKGAAYPAAFTTILVATMKCATFDLTETSGAVRLLLRDRLVELDIPIAPALFAGTGATEGTSSALNVRKPVVFGEIYSCKPQLINEVLLIYAVGSPPPGYLAWPLYAEDGQANLNPYPTPYGDYADYSGLAGASVPAGNYARCSALGLIRLGSAPTFDMTCCVKVTDAARTLTMAKLPGTIMRHMAERVGISSSDIDLADVSTVDAARTANYGYRVNSDETALSAMGKIANSASLWFGFDALGKLRMSPFNEPSGTPVFTFSQQNVTKLQKIDSVDTGIPIWKVTARSSFNFNPETTFAGSVPPWYREWHNKAWPLETQVTNASVKNKHPIAGEMTVDVYTGAGATRMDDAGEASRRLGLYGVERDMVQVTTPITLALLSAIDLAKVCMLRYPRFGWNAGKLMCIVAIAINFDAMRAEITLWG